MRVNIDEMEVKNVEALAAEFERLGYATHIEEFLGKRYLVITKVQKVLSEDVFIDALAKEQARYRRYKTPYGIIICPGHQRERIISAVRAADIVGEFDGNIVIILTNTNEESVAAAVQRLKKEGIQILESRCYA